MKLKEAALSEFFSAVHSPKHLPPPVRDRNQRTSRPPQHSAGPALLHQLPNILVVLRVASIREVAEHVSILKTRARRHDLAHPVRRVCPQDGTVPHHLREVSEIVVQRKPGNDSV
jgi:hypothetical protein